MDQVKEMDKSERFILLVLFLTALLGAELIFAPAGGASEPVSTVEKTVNGFSQNEIIEQIRAIEKRIKTAQVAKKGQATGESGARLSDPQERVAKLEAVRAVYERLLTALKKRSLLEKEEAHLRENLQDRGEQPLIPRKAPYSLSFYDTLQDELAAADQEREAANLAAALSRRTLDDAVSRQEEVGKEWRHLRDQLDAASERADRIEIERELEKRQLEKDLSEVLVKLEKIHYENLSKQATLAELQGELARRKIDEVGKQIHFDEADLGKQLESIEREKAELEKRVQVLLKRHEAARQAWLEAQSPAAGTVGEDADSRHEMLLRARKAWYETYQTVLEQAEDMLRLLARQGQVWRLRYAIVRGEAQGDELATRKEEIANHVENLDRMLSVQQNYQTSLQSEIAGLEKKVSEGGLDRGVETHLKNRISALQELAEQRFAYTSALLATKQLDLRILDETNSKLGKVSLQQRIRTLTAGFQKVWDFEIWVIDDRPLTVRKLVVALLILVIGILAAKLILRAVGRRILSYAHFQETTASAIQKILTYFSYLLVLLFALRMVNIPLAAFAFLGGAIAIGVGFGAQNLINNFISGFIMMAERPISIGDLIELEGVLGQVEEVGARCTRVRTGENIHILVPNSSFLEKNITNWTLSDRKIRAKVTVGVIYGSPVREAEKRLLRAVDENEKTLKKPDPFVIFTDFGDNALIFEVHFWINVNQIIERRLIESSIRFRIDELFREAGIVIAFPQTDVHLDAQKPIEFRLVDTKD